MTDVSDNAVEVDEENEHLRDLLEETTVEVAGEDHSLVQLIKDVRVAHQELDQYKKGSLTLTSALEDRKMVAKNDGDEQLVELIDLLKESAYGVCLRLQRGDLELLGERDGEFSGYFAE